MEVLAAMTARHAKRAFLDRPVAPAVLDRVLQAAGHAPSTRNNQPWRVCVVTGSALAELTARLCAAFDSGVKGRLGYGNRLPGVDPVAEDRAAAANIGVLRAFGEPADTPAARRAYLRRNMTFYGAPVALVCHLPAGAVPGTFLELGFFVQNVMLGLVAAGLGSCPQGSVAGYGDVVRDVLGLPPDRLLVCTLSVGHPDPAAPVNAYVPDRAALSEYVSWHDQAPEASLGPAPASVTCSQSRDRTS